MKLPVSQLSLGPHSLKLSSSTDPGLGKVAANVQAKGLCLRSGLELELELTKLDPNYYLRARMKLSVEQPCARCAETFNLPLDHRFEMAFTHVTHLHGMTHPEAQDAQAVESADLCFFEGHEINLAAIVEEQVFLSLPYQVICQENCLGICQQCGKNLNQQRCECAPRTDDFHPFGQLLQWKKKA